MRKIPLLLILCLITNSVEASFDFLSLSVSPSAQALGGCLIEEDPLSFMKNPSLIKGKAVSFMHNSHYIDIEHNIFGLTYAINKRNFVAFGANLVDWGDIAETTITQPDGTGKEFTIKDQSISLAYSRFIMPSDFPDMKVGIGLKTVKEEIAGVCANGVALDLGIFLEGRTKVGMAILNIGDRVKFKHRKEVLPIDFRADVSSECLFPYFKMFLSLGDGSKGGLGMEYKVNNIFSIRTGISRNYLSHDNFISGGIGIIHKKIAFNFSYTFDKNIENIYRFSLSYFFD